MNTRAHTDDPRAHLPITIPIPNPNPCARTRARARNPILSYQTRTNHMATTCKQQPECGQGELYPAGTTTEEKVRTQQRIKRHAPRTELITLLVLPAAHSL